MEYNFKHDEQSLRRISISLQDINKHAQRVLTEFNKLKDKELTPQEMMKLASKAAKLRFEDGDIDTTQLLKAYRNEDEGNNLWNVYNRIQENLIKSNLLVDKDGRLVSGVNNVREDIFVNTKLVELVEEFI